MNHKTQKQVLSVSAGIELFGADAAEDDPNLSSYFLKTSTWHKVLSGHTMLVLGRKGSGKSAIFRMLSEEKQKNTVVIPVTPRLFALDILNDFKNKYPDSPFNQEIAYTTAWRYSLMLELLLSIENTTGQFKFGGEAGVHEWLRKHVEFDADIISRTVAFLEKWTVDKVSIAQLSATLSNDQRRKQLVGHEIDQTIPNVEQSLKNKKYILAIDNLDEGWSNKEDARTYLAGLIMAAKELNRLNNLNVVIFMRTDMFRVLETAYQHMDKFRQSIEYIEWNPTSLARLVSLRIQKYFNIRNEKNDATWNRLFPEKMENGFLTYKHITERTFLRPREIIQFCRLIIDNVVKFKKSKADTRDVRAAEIQYSDWKLNDLSGEYSAYYKNIDKLLESFRRKSPYLTCDELENETQQAVKASDFHSIDDDPEKIKTDKVITLLYQMGFIRARFRNRHGKWRYISSASEPNLICSNVDDWDLHPAFRRKLVITGYY